MRKFLLHADILQDQFSWVRCYMFLVCSLCILSNYPANVYNSEDSAAIESDEEEEEDETVGDQDTDDDDDDDDEVDDMEDEEEEESDDEEEEEESDGEESDFGEETVSLIAVSWLDVLITKHISEVLICCFLQ